MQHCLDCDADVDPGYNSCPECGSLALEDMESADGYHYSYGEDSAIDSVIDNANEHEHKKPNMRTLWEEVAEATLAQAGKHEHPLRLELVQIAGICVNMIRQIDAGEEFKP